MVALYYTVAVLVVRYKAYKTVKPVFAVQYSFSNIVMNGGLVPYGNKDIVYRRKV